MNTIKEQLQGMETDNELKQYVIDYYIDNYENDEDLKKEMEDLQQYGCVSGMVSGLVYYNHTYAFYDKFYDEIEEMRIEWEEQTGEAIKVGNNLKNFFAWFAFEQTAFDLYTELFENTNE